MVRFKNRYFAVEIEAMDRPSYAPFEVKKAALYRCLLQKIEEIHGDFGSAAVTNGFLTKYCNPYTKIALIRCRHGAHRFVSSVLPLINEIQNVPIKCKIIYIGATIMKCYKFIIRHQQKCLEKYWHCLKTDSDRQQMKEAFLKLSNFEVKLQ